MNKGIVTAIGFIIFILGFLSIILSLVGLQLTTLGIISGLGAGAKLAIHLSMIFGGVIVMYMSKMPMDDEEYED